MSEPITATTSEGKATILVVDDTPENIDILAGLLSDRYAVKVAMNGDSAIALARAEPVPDLILLDVMMPEMDGYEVCHRLKADPLTAKIPVIFATAKTEVADETKGFEAGAIDYLTKPISPPIVLARVKTQLALKEAREHIESVSEKLSRYLSPQIYRSIFEGKQDAAIGTSRKKLTVFFSDIVGFSSQTDSMEPEDLAFLLNGYLNAMAQTVLKHGGTLDKFIGDAVLVFFGDPESRGVREDAIACLEMALEMKNDVERLKGEWAESGITSPFEIRMGITTGYCNVGNFGSDLRMDYTIIGNEVNLASRLESNAQPGEILISRETHALVADDFECVPKDPINAKGFPEPVPVFQVVARWPEGKCDATMNSEKPGFSLTLDAEAIQDADREEVIASLRAAISKLR
jgi:adenylate cyclase